MGIAQRVSETEKVFLALLSIGLIGIVFLIVFGNLQNNLGFASGTQGARDTNAVIGNLTGGAVAFFGFANVWFVLLAVVLLIIIVMSVVRVAKMTGGSDKNFSN